MPSKLIVAHRFAWEQAEIKTLVVNHKWMARDVQQAVMQELLTGRTCLA